MSNISKTREMIIGEFLKCLEQDQVPWERGWNIIHHYNPHSNHTYLGNNSMLLSLVAEIENYVDPRWMTFNQIRENGYSLENAKGKGVPIEFWSAYDKLKKRNITQSEVNDFIENGEQDRISYICKTYYVFNAAHIKGIEPFQKKEVSIDNKSIEQFLHTYLKNENIELIHGGSSAYYTPSKDNITIPLLDVFKSEEFYFDTLMHEIGHSTGHEKRLNRDLSGKKGSELYAKEELCAELASSFLNVELGLEMSEKSLDRHKAYIQSWIKCIKEKPNELFNAIKKSEKIVDFVKEQGQFEKFIDKGVQSKEKIKKVSIKERAQQAKKILKQNEPNKDNKKTLEISK